jgi:hypothetical protein
VGKSTVCARVAEEAVHRGFRVGGIITERSEASSVFLADVDSRFLVDLSTGERVPFGRRCGEVSQPPCAGPLAGTVDTADPMFPLADDLTPGWEFGSQVFRFGERAIVSAADSDLLIVDELGPLELRGGRGWAAALPVLRAAGFGAALVVCRPELMEELRDVLESGSGGSATEESGHVRLPVFSLTAENRGAIFSRLTRELLVAVSSNR